MIIDCIADLHGFYPELEGGDLLIVAGDLTERDTPEEVVACLAWIETQNYKKKVFIAGNHDNFIEKRPPPSLSTTSYLCDSGTEFEGLKIWGSPWTKSFPGMNPKAKAFTVDTDEKLADKWELIPKDIDILITHGPAYGLFDEIQNYNIGKILNLGSKSLLKKLLEIKPTVHIFGHIHEGAGNKAQLDCNKKITFYANVSLVNEYYKPTNKPIRIILDEDKVIKNDDKRVAYD